MKPQILLPILLVSLMAFKTAPRKKVIFFGDSITQMGVQNGGYIDLMNKQLTQSGRAEQFELIGAGIGGNKVYDLYLRVQEDVLAKKPDIVFIYVGINDVWHKTVAGTGTDKDKFEKFYIALIRLFRQNGIQVILCTPTLIGEKKNGTNPQDKDLNEYSDVIRKLAKENNCSLVDLRALCFDFLSQNNKEDKETGVLTYDRVHLNATGNQLVADAMLQKL